MLEITHRMMVCVKWVKQYATGEINRGYFEVIFEVCIKQMVECV